MIGRLVLGAVVALTTASPTVDTPTHTTSTRPPCVGRVVVFAADVRPPCDVNPPQRLDVVGGSRDECDHYGGRFRIVDRRCFDVDY